MQNENVQNSFQRGTMPMVILALLKKEDMYGYQLVQEATRQSGGRIVTQEGSLYPVLYKLEDQGLISGKKVQVGKRMTRIYYHLEPAGEKRLEELVEEYRMLTQGVFQIIQEVENNEVECGGVSLPAPCEEMAAKRRPREKADHDAATAEGERLPGGLSEGYVPKPC